MASDLTRVTYLLFICQISSFPNKAQGERSHRKHVGTTLMNAFDIYVTGDLLSILSHISNTFHGNLSCKTMH